MSVSSQTGHYQVSNTVALAAAHPTSTVSFAYWIVGRVLSDIAHVPQVILDSTFDGGNSAVGLYYDIGTDLMYLISILPGSTPKDLAIFGSRPPLNVWCIFYIHQSTSGGTLTGGWQRLDTQPGFVTASCVGLTTGETGVGYYNQGITSNSNPCHMDLEIYRCAQTPRTEPQYLADSFVGTSLQTCVFDFQLNSTASIVEKTGNGATLATQGGTLSNGGAYPYYSSGAQVGSLNGLALSSVSHVNGLAKASIANLNGLTLQ